jgi:hypothetical protein
MRGRKKFRVIVRPWIPRKLPYQVATLQVKEVLKEAYPKLGLVVYVGWIRKIIKGQKKLLYLVATGNTSIEARKAFKLSEDLGKNVWIVNPSA